MNLTVAPAPVRKSIHVKADPARAFEVFTAKIDRWWPRGHSIGRSPMAAAILEPEVGGRWYERGTDGSECQWGEVLVWEPPARLVLSWQINGQWAYDPDLVTEVEVRFAADGEGTRVDLEHRHLERFGPAADAIRARFDSEGGWGGLLRQMAAAL